MAPRDRSAISTRASVPGGVGVSVLEQVVLGFPEGVVDDHPGLLVGFEMQVEAAVVTEPEPARILRVGRWHLRFRDGFRFDRFPFGKVVGRARLDGIWEPVLAEDSAELTHGEHRGEFGDPMVGPRRGLADDGGHLIERELTAVERVEHSGSSSTRLAMAAIWWAWAALIPVRQHRYCSMVWMPGTCQVPGLASSRAVTLDEAGVLGVEESGDLVQLILESLVEEFVERQHGTHNPRIPTHVRSIHQDRIYVRDAARAAIAPNDGSMSERTEGWAARSSLTEIARRWRSAARRTIRCGRGRSSWRRSNPCSTAC